MTVYAILATFALVSVYAIYAHTEIMHRQADERLQHQLRVLEAAEKRQAELTLVIEAFLQHKGVPITLQQKPRELRPASGYFDRKPIKPLSAEERQEQ